MILQKCNECGYNLHLYKDESFVVRICWLCGYYESNSPAFKLNPSLYVDMVRENPSYFMNKFCKSDENLQGDNNDNNRRRLDGTKHRKIY